MKKLFIFIIFIVVVLFISPQSTRAVTFDLIAPSGELSQGQDVRFTINIDTEGRSFTSTQVGMTYDVRFLEYVSISPGSTFTTVSADPQDGGKIIITGSSTSGYSGAGSFATITFKIIAQSSGATQLCALYNPSIPTPSPGPLTPTSVPLTPIPITPIPTALPKTGSFVESSRGIISGLAMIIIAIVSLILFKKA